MIPKSEDCRDIAPRDDSRDRGKCQLSATLRLITIASQLDLKIADVLYYRLHSQIDVNPGDCLVVFLVREEIKQIGFLPILFLLTVFTEQARLDLCRRVG